MAFERVGVRAVLEGASEYISNARRINAETRAIGQASEEAARKSEQLTQRLNRQAESLRNISGNLQTVGTQAVLFGAALTAPLAGSALAAVSFESAFADVRKTIDATEEQFAELSDGILELSKRLPLSANEIAGVAAAAGQLGVARENVLTFTETMLTLGATTNLTANDAATAFARFTNILQIPQSEVDRLASSLVDLGNNSATTEAEILELGLRIAGAGNIVGLTGDEVLAFAAALSSVGVRSEAGGTAISRTFVEIANAVDEGGESLARFAEVAGQTSEEFAASFEENAAEATVRFIEGLGQIDAAGGSTFAVLEELSLADNRLRDSLLRAAGAGDLLRESLDLSSTAYEENTAATDELANRLATADAQLKILLNTIKAAAIETGTAFLPVITTTAQVLGGLVEAFTSLPGPVRVATVAILGGVGALVAITGAGLVFAGVLGNLAAGMLQLVPAATQASLAVRGLGLSMAALATGPVGLIALAGSLVTAAVGFALFRNATDEATEAQTRLAAANAIVAQQTEQQIRGQINELQRSNLELEAQRENLEAVVAANGLWNDAGNEAAEQLSVVLRQLEANNAQLATYEEAAGLAADQTALLDQVQSGLEEALASTADQAAGLTGELQTLSSAALAAALAVDVLSAETEDPSSSLAVYESAVARLRGVVAQEEAIAGLADLLLFSASGKRQAEELNRQIEEQRQIRQRGYSARASAAKDAADELARIEEEAAQKRLDFLRDLSERRARFEEEDRRRRVAELNEFGGIVVNALRAQAQARLNAETERIAASRKVEEDAYQRRIERIEDERDTALEAIRVMADARVRALESELEQIDEVRFEEELAALERERALAFEREKQVEIDARIKDLLRRRREEEIRGEIADVRDAQSQQEEAVRDAAQERIEARNRERDQVLASLDAEEAAARETYSAVTQQYQLEADARVLIEQGAQEQIVALLESFAPDWRSAGISLGEALVGGIRSVPLPSFVGGGLAAAPTSPQGQQQDEDRKDLIAKLNAQGAREKREGTPEFVLNSLRQQIANLGGFPRFRLGGTVPGAPHEEVPIVAHGREVIVPFNASTAASAMRGGPTFERGAFDGMFRGASFNGSPRENADAIRDAFVDLMGEVSGRGSYLAGY